MGNDFFGHFPESIGTRRDEKSIHSPVVVFAECDPVIRVVVGLLAVRDEMSGIDEGEVADFRHADAKSAGSALAVVDFEDLFPEGGASAGSDLIVIIPVLTNPWSRGSFAE